MSADSQLGDFAAGLALADAATAAFRAACTGDDEPHLWRLTWAENLFDDLWTKAIEGEEFEDPDAMAEAYGHTKRMFELLRAALAQAEGKGGDAHA